MNNDNPVWRISPWSAEFRDPRTEAAFRRFTAESMASHLRLSLLLWAGLLLGFGLLDYLLIEIDGSSHLLAIGRLCVLALLGLLWLRSRSSPQSLTDGRFITVVEIISFTAFCLIFFLRPELTVPNLGVIMVMLMATYVLVPNRLVTATLAVGYGIAATLVSMWLIGVAVDALFSLFLLFVVPASLGHVAAVRLQRNQREQYALLCRAEQVNEQLSREIERRELLEEELRQQAITDPLTGLLNRRHFETLFKQELERLRRSGGDLTLCMADLDHFKEVNDNHGHECGDRVLQTVASFLQSRVRQADVVCRLGGEEFVLLLPDTSAAEAGALVDRIRADLAMQLTEVEHGRVGVTATFSVTRVDTDTDSLATALRKADQALYQGKESGRNRLIVVAA